MSRLIAEAEGGRVGEVRMVSVREHRFPFLKKVGDWNRGTTQLDIENSVEYSIDFSIEFYSTVGHPANSIEISIEYSIEFSISN